MRDYLPDELPAMSYRPEDYEMMDILWDKQIEEMYWIKLMTMPLEGDQPGARREERRNETTTSYHNQVRNSREEMMILPIDEAEQTKKNYVCSTCWGHLATFRIALNPKSLMVACANQNCEGVGFVTKAWVEKQRAQNAADKVEAANNLKDILPGLNKPPRDEQTILSELGF